MADLMVTIATEEGTVLDIVRLDDYLIQAREDCPNDTEEFRREMAIETMADDIRNTLHNPALPGANEGGAK